MKADVEIDRIIAEKDPFLWQAYCYKGAEVYVSNPTKAPSIVKILKDSGMFNLVEFNSDSNKINYSLKGTKKSAISLPIENIENVEDKEDKEELPPPPEIEPEEKGEGEVPEDIEDITVPISDEEIKEEIKEETKILTDLSQLSTELIKEDKSNESE